MRVLPGLLILLLWAGMAWGMTGTEWNNYDAVTHQAYVLGLVNGWNFASLKDGNDKWKQLYAPLNTCQMDRKMTVGQLAAILDKYLKENPEEWNYSVASILFNRLDAICQPRQ